MNSKELKTYFYLLFILFIINFLFTKQDLIEYTMKISRNKQNLDVFHIDVDDVCNQWIPSLLSPLLLVFRPISLKNYLDKIEIINPLEIGESNTIDIYIYSYDFFEKKYNAFFGKSKDEETEGLCYLGLLPKEGVNKNLNENYILLKHLRDSNQIKSIFSFDEWIISQELITTKFYLGESHSHFSQNKENGIIGACNTNKSDLFWGCSFDQMEYNGKITNLTKDDINFNIYFSSESHIIKFPRKFEQNFNDITGQKCTYDESAHKGEIGLFLSCDELLNENNYFLISLINNDMNITIEIDGNKRFNKGEDIDERTRIIYEDIDYFLLPLIMFKNFHIEFDDEDNLIKFYTNDSSILHVKEKKKKEEEKKGGISKGLLAFIIVLIIVGVIALIFLVFWLLKKRKESVRNSINKYNKFEDEEDFKNMNEKKVF